MCEHDHRGDRDASGLFAGPVLALDLLNNFSWRGRAFRAGWLSRQDGLLRGLSATGLGRRRAPGSASLPGTRHGRHWSGYSQVETCSVQHEAARPQRCKRFGGRGRIQLHLSQKATDDLWGLFVARTDPLKHICYVSLRIAFRLGYVADNFEQNIVVCLVHRLRLANGVD
jgi:hypothetical protein